MATESASSLQAFRRMRYTNSRLQHLLAPSFFRVDHTSRTTTVESLRCVNSLFQVRPEGELPKTSSRTLRKYCIERDRAPRCGRERLWKFNGKTRQRCWRALRWSERRFVMCTSACNAS